MEDHRSPELQKLDAEIKENVQRGLVFLREKYGDDWVEHINMKTLDLRSGAACVLGQVHPQYFAIEDWETGYDAATEEFKELRADDGEKHGFTTYEEWRDDPDDPEGGLDVWDSLQSAWEQVIPDEQRRVDRKRQAGLLDAK